jgi:NTP pyrophosphatase (non-canonical NTP hydrolase)
MAGRKFKAPAGFTAIQRVVNQLQPKTIKGTQARIKEWGEPIFTRSTPMSTVKHMHKEVNELITATHLMDRENMGEEAADILHMLFHYCNAAGLDLAEEFEKKFAINKARTWLTPNEEGIVFHDPKGEH